MRIPRTQFLAIIFLVFLIGAIAHKYDVFPATLVDSAPVAYKALIVKHHYDTDPLHVNMYSAIDVNKSGVTSYDPTRAYNGYTLYTSAESNGAVLVDMHGKVVHRWIAPYYDVFPGERSKKDLGPSYVMTDAIHLDRNGDLYIVYVGVGDTPWGYGIAKVDTNSRVIWKYPGKVHHALDVMPDGTVYVLDQRIVNGHAIGFGWTDEPVLDDGILVLNSHGRPVKRVSLIKAIENSPYASVIDRVVQYADFQHLGDYLHTNDLQVLTEKTAAMLPNAKAGDVLVSFRNLDSLAVVDMKQKTVVWWLRGGWLHQHDVDLLPNGHMMLFDNLGSFGTAGSRVIEFDPKSQKIIWSYSGSPDDPLYSEIRSAQQRLPNGNTLITDSDQHRIVEVTHSGDIVWEYYNPARIDKRRVPVIRWAQRFAPADLPFLKNASGGK